MAQCFSFTPQTTSCLSSTSTTLYALSWLKETGEKARTLTVPLVEKAAKLRKDSKPLRTKIADKIKKNPKKLAKKIVAPFRKDKSELKQRALLEARLNLHNPTTTVVPPRITTVETAKSGLHEMAKAAKQRLKRPSPPGMLNKPSKSEERKMARKYASIDCIEERTFVMLKDLGIVESSVDFNI